MVEWYTADQWKAYICWFSPPWASPRERFDAREWVDNLLRAGFRVAVMHTKHHDGVCFFRSKYRSAQPERDFVGEFTAEAHRRGVRVVAYYSTTPDAWSTQEHPEWSCVDLEGRPVELTWSPFPLGVCCINNPGYREFLLGQLEEIQEQYKTDGFWMDIFGYHHGPKPQCCFCRHCRTGYARASGGRDLRESWDTEDAGLWYRDSFLRLLREIRSIADRDGTERVFVYNGSGAESLVGYDAIDRECSSLSYEAHRPLVKSLASRLLCHRGTPFELFTPVSESVDSWTVRAENLLALEAAIVTAHGGSVLAGFDVKPDGAFLASQMETLGRVATRVRAREEYTRDAQELFDVGLMVPTHHGLGGSWAGMLLRGHLPFAVLRAGMELDPYQLVIVDEDVPLTEQLADGLERYVQRGGNLLIAAGARSDSPSRVRLSRLLGVEWCGPTGFDHHYLGQLDETIGAGPGSAPVRADGRAWKVEPTTAQVLARFVYPIAQWSRERWLWTGPNPPSNAASPDPAITVNRFGTGTAVLLGFSVSREEDPDARSLVSVLRNLARSLVPEPLVRVTGPSHVEVVVCRQGGRHVIHVINHLVEQCSYHDDADGVPRLSGISVRLNANRIGPVHRVQRVGDAEGSAPAVEDAWIHVRVPELGVHEILILDGKGAGNA